MDETPGGRRTVVLHAGLPKTGTTAIQSALRDYDDGSTVYATLGPANHSVLFHTLFGDDHHWAHWQRIGLSEAEHQDLVDKYRSALEEQLSRKSSRIIFSAEKIPSMKKGAIARIRDYFNSKSFDIQVIVFVREPLAWTASLVQEQIKHAHFPDKFIEREIPLRSLWREQIDNLISVFGKETVSIHRYERAVSAEYSGDVVQYLIDHLGLTESLRKPDGSVNKSLSEEALKVLVAFHHSGVVHNKGAMLERVRWQFIACLNNALTGIGANKPENEAFLPFVDWADYRRLNELLDEPYVLKDCANDSNSNRTFKAYCADMDEAAISPALHKALSDFGLAAPRNANVTELAILLFYGVMRDDAQRPLKSKLEEAQGQLAEIAALRERTTRNELQKAMDRVRAFLSPRFG